MSDTIEVTLAYPYTDADGEEHAADSTITLPRHVGKDLIHAGRARLPKPKPAPKSPAKKASGNPATTATAQKEK